MFKKEKKQKTDSEKQTRQKKIPRTVQQTIPYEAVYPNGIFKIGSKKYCKSYRLEDTNFSIADQQTQENMFLDYEGLLNSIDVNMMAQVTVHNRSINMDIVKNKMLMKPKSDGRNEFREELNTILMDKMNEGRNNLKKEKYFTITVETTSIETAAQIFKRIDSEVSDKVGRITKKGTAPMTLEERLAVLYDIYNENTEFPFEKKIEHLMSRDMIDLASLNAAGLSTKDLIGPESFSFKQNYFTMGDLYGRAMFLDNLPTFMNANILTELSDLPCNMLTSVIYRPIPADEAAKMVKHQITNINENIIRQQKKAARGNYSADIMPSELQRASEEAKALRVDMQSRNQKLFKVSVVIVLFATSKEELEQNTEALKAIGLSNIAQVKNLNFQQEAGLKSALPLCNLDVALDRVLNTEASAIFFPFAVEELYQEGGLYYGLNAVSKNVIMYNRMRGDSYNGVILGKPGSGKSFIAKSEIVNILLGTDDDVFVIDPQGEYQPLADALGGEVIHVGIKSDTHVNPLDMDVQYAGDIGDPVAMKCDFLTAICETIVGHGNLDPIMVNTIHKAGKKIYKPYIEHMRLMVNHKDAYGNRITCDRQATPTLVDFYQELISMDDPTAQLLASAIEMYCVGNYDLFAKQTNVNPNSRFVVYDIKNMPVGMKELALQICMNDAWNRIIANKRKKKITRLYIDEFHVVLQTKSSAEFVTQIYRMARKWGGVPTGITQNAEYMLTSEESRAILSTCNFVLMMNQSSIDRAALSDMFSISESLQDYITDKPAGTGLMYTGSTIIPFVNQFPKDTMLYKLMSTKLTETDDDVLI